MEATFRDQQLQPTLKDKEAQLRAFKEKREIIAQQEREIDEFVDKSHSLLHASGIERIKPLISQVSNRYVELFQQENYLYIYHPCIRVCNKILIVIWQVRIGKIQSQNKNFKTEYVLKMHDLL